jgi:LuxR family transcriptional regulator, maltose regulon positive regulatory protein
MDGSLSRPSPLTRSAAEPTARTSEPSGTTGFPAPELVSTKLVPPVLRPGLIARAGLQSLLQAGLDAKLCLLDAPAGSGKTTLLAQWCATAGAGRVAWVSLDESDNDPTRLWTSIGQALRSVEPDVGTAALRALQRTSVDLERMVLPSLLNDLNGIGQPLVLVLDDYHLVTEATCHQSLTFFLDHLPPGVHLLLATRVDPPLPLASMRAKGELAELRVADLQFTDEEAAALLNGAMGLQLATEDVERLAERTEGWAAGLYLAGLSLRGREDSSAFIAAFSGDNRHVADYLAAEVLARQPEEIRTFLLRTSILPRLSGPLCDDVLETAGSAELLEELERSNLFLLRLDDRRQWYRYHHLFGELLRLELGTREAALIPALHRRAAAWHRRYGHVEETIHHATAAGEFADVGELIAAHWLAHWRSGRRATVSRWIDGLPEDAVLAHPPVAFVAAWIGGFGGASRQERERLLAVVDEVTWQGALPDGVSSLAFGAALARAALLFDDVGGALQAARRALQLAGPEPSPFHWMAQAALGQASYLSGRSAEAGPPLEELTARVLAAAQPYAVITALAVLSLMAGDEDDDQTAMSLADRAAAIAEIQGLSAEPLCGIMHMALGRALTRQGRLAEAQERLDWALEVFMIDGMAVHRAHALLLLAAARHAQGDLLGARALRDRAHELIEQMADPGLLPALLQQTSRMLGSASRRRARAPGSLTQRELAVLRLLPTRLSTTEIAQELHVSVNTVRSQVQSVYRKLEVSSRPEAVTQARQLGLLSGSTHDGPWPFHLDE